MLRRHMIAALGLLAVTGPPAAASSDYPIVPAGVEITVRLQERIESRSASPGDTFQAEVVNPVEVEGKTLIPGGAPARLELVLDHDFAPGDAKVFAIEIQSIQIGGDWRPVTTGFAELESGVRKVRAGPDKEIPAGTTDLDKIVAAPAHGGNAALATVRGAGVTFHVLHGPELEADAGITAYFTLAELLSLRPEETVK